MENLDIFCATASTVELVARVGELNAHSTVRPDRAPPPPPRPARPEFRLPAPNVAPVSQEAFEAAVLRYAERERAERAAFDAWYEEASWYERARYYWNKCTA